MAAVAFSEGRLPRRSWLEATPTEKSTSFHVRMPLRGITRFFEIHRSGKYPGAHYAHRSLPPPALKD
jgi:hypothetical protein